MVSKCIIMLETWNSCSIGDGNFAKLEVEEYTAFAK